MENQEVTSNPYKKKSNQQIFFPNTLMFDKLVSGPPDLHQFIVYSWVKESSSFNGEETLVGSRLVNFVKFVF